MKDELLPASWTRCRLADLCSHEPDALVGGPFGSDLTSADYQPMPGVPVIRGTNLGGSTGAFVDDGFVFVSDSKARSLARNRAARGDVIFTQRGTLGQVSIVPADARYPYYVISQSQMRMRPDLSRVVPRFVFHYFRTPQALSAIQRRALTTGVPHINLGILKEFPVALPTLQEQRRIADILDRADAMRAKRREAIALCDTLRGGIFETSFDDSVAARHAPLGDMAEVQGGLQVTSARAGLAIEVAYLRVANVARGSVSTTEMKSIRLTESELRRTRLLPGDLLLVEGHGNPNEVGRAGMWSGEIDPCVHQNHLIRVRPNDQRSVARFLCDYLNSRIGRRHLVKAGNTTSGLNTISVADVRETPIPLVPLERQRAYADRALAVDAMESHHRSSLAELDALFASLQHRAFRAEL